jgi:hypothetical protein
MPSSRRSTSAGREPEILRKDGVDLPINFSGALYFEVK